VRDVYRTEQSSTKLTKEKGGKRREGASLTHRAIMRKNALMKEKGLLLKPGFKLINRIGASENHTAESGEQDQKEQGRHSR